MAVNGVISDLFDLDGNWVNLSDWQLFPEYSFDNDLLQQAPQEGTKTDIKQEVEVEPEPVRIRRKVTINTTEDQINELKVEIAKLVKRQESLPSTDNRIQKRQIANAVAATLTRRRKALLLLEKDQQIEMLQEQNALLENENRKLKAALAQSSQYYEQASGEFSITIPETTMLIKYQGPVSSPSKPKVMSDERATSYSAIRI